MNVKELIEILKEHDQSAEIKLCVYSHTYCESGQQQSHGPMNIVRRQRYLVIGPMLKYAIETQRI